jgi:hypothetical protein
MSPRSAPIPATIDIAASPPAQFVTFVAARGCFRLEHFAGWDFHPLESAALSRRTPTAAVVGQFILHRKNLMIQSPRRRPGKL